MSYDVYWVKNRAEKIADFEHPTFQGTYFFGICTHSCAASQLAVGFIIKVPLRGTRSSYSICLRSWVRGYGETP